MVACCTIRRLVLDGEEVDEPRHLEHALDVVVYVEYRHRVAGLAGVLAYALARVPIIV